MRKIKKKKIDRKKLFYTLGFFIFCVFGLTVAYSALSTTLNISGSAEIPNSSFGIKVEKASIEEIFGQDFLKFFPGNISYYDNYLVLGNGRFEREPIISGTSINNFEVSTQIPGDGIMAYYKITNVGDIPVQYTDILVEDYQFESPNIESLDMEWLSENIILDSDFGKSDLSDSFNINDVLCPGEVIYYYMIFRIAEEATTLPADSIKITIPGIEYVFVQTDKSACS